MSEARQISCDVLIIGAGSAGCVVASRLSEDPSLKVVLAEAGSDFGPDENAEIANLYPLSYFNPDYLWPNTMARWSQASPQTPFPVGRGVGGSSLVMGMWALRGFPQDYDEWEQGGATGWNWTTLLPYFDRIENDLDFPRAGDPGPVAIHRQKEATWPVFTRRVVEAAKQQRLKYIPDINTQFEDGIYRVPISATHSSRVSTARAYLSAEVRRRRNLLILSDAECERLLVADKNVTGAVLRRRNGPVHVRTRLTVLSAGAIGSPRLLMKSGIANAIELKNVGIDVVHHLPAVGKNLQNHAGVTLGVHLSQAAASTPISQNSAFVAIRASSTMMRSDLYFSVLDRTSWSYFGARVAAINTVLHKPFSRGRVMLERISGGLKVTPEFQFLSDERDGPRLFRALLLADALIQSTSVRPLVRQTGIVKMSNLIRRITKRSTANSIFDHVSGALLPRMPAVEAQIIRQILRTAPQDTGPSDIMLASQGLSNMVTGLFHPVGSCRMGARDDDAAVVTSDGLVRGLSGLCVCDASIMPSIPRANTNLPTMMIGERMSDIIKDMLRQQPA